MSHIQELCDHLVANDAEFKEFSWPDDRDLSGDELSRLCAALKQNHTVETICFDEMYLKVSRRTCLRLGVVLSVHTAVKKLQIQQVIADEGGLIDEFGLLAAAFAQNESMTCLSFEYCDLTPSIIDGIQFLLESNTIEELEISDCFVPEEQQVFFDGSLAGNTSLRKLTYDLNCRCDFESEIVNEIPRLLESNTSLQHLEVSRLELDDYLRHQVFASIFVAASGHVALQSLTLRHDKPDEDTLHFIQQRNIGFRMGEAISNMVRNSPALRELVISEFYLDSDGVTHFANALAQNESIETLKLSIFVKSEELILIARALRSNSSLRSLTCHNGGDHGTSEIAEMLTVNTTLQDLTLYQVSDIGLQEFSRLLPNMSGLKSLYCSYQEERDSRYSEFRPETLVMIGSALKQNTTLEAVDLSPISSRRKKMNLAHHYTNLNKGGRRILASQEPLPLSFWPQLLAKSSNEPDILYYFLQQKPDVLISQCHDRTPRSRKRKRGDADEDLS